MPPALVACAQATSARAQDFLTSAFLVTSRDCFYTRAEAAALAAFMGDACDAVDLPPPALLKPLELWTGKQMFALLVRPSARSRCGPARLLGRAHAVPRPQAGAVAAHRVPPCPGHISG